MSTYYMSKQLQAFLRKFVFLEFQFHVVLLKDPENRLQMGPDLGESFGKPKAYSKKLAQTRGFSVTHPSSFELLPGQSLIQMACLRTYMSAISSKIWLSSYNHHLSLSASSAKTDQKPWKRYFLSTLQMFVLFSEAAIYAILLSKSKTGSRRKNRAFHFFRSNYYWKVWNRWSRVYYARIESFVSLCL